MPVPLRHTWPAGGVAAALALIAWPTAAAAPTPPGGEVRAAQDGRPANPCLGPERRELRCPRWSIDKPRDLYFERRPSGRLVLRATNSLNSVGTGPVEFRAKRIGRRTMAGVQKIHKRGGGKISVKTGARIRFKRIPGQYRYWKLYQAARFELWTIDDEGRRLDRVRVGPKLYYCLRDLRRTRPHLPGSPRGPFYPACSQRAKARAVTLGTSVGWSDIYPSTYHENWIDVTGLHGRFRFVMIVDPTNVVYTTNRRPARSSTIVRIP